MRRSAARHLRTGSPRWLSFAVAGSCAIWLGTHPNIVGSLTFAAAPPVDVLTYHNDNARTGQNQSETILTPGSVAYTSFGKVGFLPVDGKVDAQPLYLSAVPMSTSGIHDVVYVATEHDSVYAFDAESSVLLWKVSLLGPGETTSDARSCGQVTPEIGITSTPVIDRSQGPNGVIYVVAMSMSQTGSYIQRLHALDVTTGAELLGGPRTIGATVFGFGSEGSSGVMTFDPGQHEDRAALLLTNGSVITTWSSHCDIAPYTGWIISYDAATLAPKGVLAVTPNGSDGGIWMAGGGPAADAAGNAFLLTGNGDFDTTLDGSGFPVTRNFGNAFLKLSTASGLAVSDYFTPFDTVSQSAADLDIGSGGVLLLPDSTDIFGIVRHLAVGTGKDQRLYVYNRDWLGRFSPSRNYVFQEIDGVLSGGMFSVPAYFNNRIYFGAIGDSIKAFSLILAHVSTSPISQTTRTFGYPGITPSISANGTSNGILWAVQNGNPAVLYAYDAQDLTMELYNSNQEPTGRDRFGAGNKFIAPMIANGRVFVGTQTGVAVFGSLTGQPGAPGNLRGSVSGSTVSLAWDAPTTGSAPTSYVIDGEITPGACSAGIGSYASGNTATALVAPSIPNGTYYFCVRGQNSSGVGPASSELLLPVGVPGPPTGFLVTKSGTTVTAQWSPASIGAAATSYVIEVSVTPSWSQVFSATTTATSMSGSTSGSPAGTYYLRVRASNAAGTSVPSNQAVLTLP
jgi:hypothetical protein